MKKQKRDQANRIFQRGYQSGVSGKSKDHCPYDSGDTRNQWLSGWREGRNDQWSGYIGVAGIHKVSAIQHA